MPVLPHRLSWLFRGGFSSSASPWHVFPGCYIRDTPAMHGPSIAGGKQKSSGIGAASTAAGEGQNVLKEHRPPLAEGSNKGEWDPRHPGRRSVASNETSSGYRG